MPGSWLSFATFLSIAYASSGDKSGAFQSCVHSCKSTECISGADWKLPLSLRLARWSCEDNCKYSCMHTLTDNAIKSGQEIHQYYGKWPFWRLAGMQEPASVFFSLLNLYGHIKGGRDLLKCVPDQHPMKTYYLVWCVVNMNAWVWSSVFHTRDTPITEMLDYFSAGLAILYSLCYTVVRLFHMHKPSYTLRPLSTGSPQSHHFLGPWILICSILYLAHVLYLTSSPRFDYTYNIIANLAVGLVHNTLWLLFSLPRSPLQRFPHRTTHFPLRHAYKASIFVALTIGATMLELFDFPPWGRIIDAHSLWHLSTAPIVSFWYSFLIEDSLEEGWRSEKG